MKVLKIFKKLTLNKWKEVNLKSFNDFYLIGIKGKGKKRDAVNAANIKKIKFEIAVETGIKNKHITVGYINLNFDDVSSSDIELNKITSYTKYMSGPSKFFIKANEIIDDTNTSYKEGKASVIINLNPQNLG